MKPLDFIGSSLDDLRNFPEEARKEAGFELYAVQRGFEPGDWKPMPSIGRGVIGG
jgi:phage-related protein